MSNSKFVQAPYAVFEDAAMPYLPDGGGQAAAGGGLGGQTQPHGRLEAAKRRNERALMAIDGVEGVSLGQTAIGREAIVVYLRDSSVKPRVPLQVEGYPVETSITGQIDIQRW
ncbi:MULTISPECIES: hypothetical protein [unclassified Janthinobacterium]|uniref:hypothetical protein n=1 Tax=unclassified Janthinobacterium TaxID=2610881 RepID=UPI0008F47EB1|nr:MULTISPECIES: hypothetical protein [unclassified Janthinobacterium]APA68518.1 hypothetical protein YQ44_12615 [Janthinobacterium sp. 1_2014MBL_MicDiv]MDN2710311.1 hypothetical protein [Janthinobacterium sp. SUN118]